MPGELGYSTGHVNKPMKSFQRALVCVKSADLYYIYRIEKNYGKRGFYC
jgi:hypothetical protein